MKPPCKNCPDRYPGCHSSCEEYTAYADFRKAILEKRHRENCMNDNLWLISRNSKYQKRKK